MWHVASNGLDAVVSCCSHRERDFWCVVRPRCKNNWSDRNDLVVSVVEAGADFHSHGSPPAAPCAHATRACPQQPVRQRALVYTRVICAPQCCGWRCWSLCDDSLSLSLCKSESGRGPLWHVFSPRLHLCLWHSELGLTKERVGRWGGEGCGWAKVRRVVWWCAGCQRLGGASRGENVMAAQSHGLASIHASGTGSRMQIQWKRTSVSNQCGHCWKRNPGLLMTLEPLWFLFSIWNRI